MKFLGRNLRSLFSFLLKRSENLKRNADQKRKIVKWSVNKANNVLLAGGDSNNRNVKYTVAVFDRWTLAPVSHVMVIEWLDGYLPLTVTVLRPTAPSTLPPSSLQFPRSTHAYGPLLYVGEQLSDQFIFLMHARQQWDDKMLFNEWHWWTVCLTLGNDTDILNNDVVYWFALKF